MSAVTGTPAIAFGIALASVGTAVAQEAARPAQEPASATEQVVVTGTRVQGRVSTETLSPVDVVSGADLADQASSDLTDQLRNISPSFNTQRYPIADGTAFVRPANLRNLSPDQTLVLINGSRRHRSALVNLQTEPFGTVNQGAQAVDFGIIPSNAIRSIEVLRDGAAAQYGSDAIAGVINVMLRNDTDGLELSGQYGKYGEGDGENLRVGANFGFALGDAGFLNAAAEYVSSDITSRGSPRPDAAAVAAVVGADRVPFDGFGQRWGDPDVQGVKVFVNGEIAPSETFAIHGYLSYADIENTSGFFYRAPVGVPGVTPRATLFVDNDGNGRPDPVDQALINSIVARGLNPGNYVTADASSPSGYVALNPVFTRFPGGYNPTFGADVTDYAAVGGVRGELSGGLRWDVTARFGRDDMSYKLDNSINPGLGSTSPLNFRPGDLSQRETGLNLDFVYPIDAGLANPVNVAFGAEYREEKYVIEAGDPQSYEFGPTGILFGVGSDGFQGDSPDAAGEFARESYAAYVDVETDLTDRWSAGAAVRGEDYEDFGSTFNWKLSTRFEITDAFAIRGTVNTGFRAPTPGQVSTLDVTTTADASGNLVPLGTFPVASPAATALGSTPLDPEDSFSYSAGVVFTPNATFNVTLDYYEIDIDDRIALATINVAPGSAEQLALINAGVPGATLLRTVSYFANGVDSTVRGADLSATAVFTLPRGDLSIDFQHAWNEQKVDRVLAGTIDEDRVFDLENQLPNHRSVLTFGWSPTDVLHARLRFNRFGGWEDRTFGEVGSFGAKTLVDLEGSVRIAERVTVAAGGENIFDEFPDEETNSVLTSLGATQPLSSPFGFNGAFWYLRLKVDF
jgi:iron complex outermembrane receptor protein